MYGHNDYDGYTNYRLNFFGFLEYIKGANAKSQMAKSKTFDLHYN